MPLQAFSVLPFCKQFIALIVQRQSAISLADVGGNCTVCTRRPRNMHYASRMAGSDCFANLSHHSAHISIEPRKDEPGFPCGIESIENVLNCESGFQDLEKVLNLAKMYIKY